jgi:hypothetical protein
MFLYKIFDPFVYTFEAAVKPEPAIHKSLRDFIFSLLLLQQNLQKEH